MTRKYWFEKKSKKEVSEIMSDLVKKRFAEAKVNKELITKIREQIKEENNDRLLGSWVRGLFKAH